MFNHRRGPYTICHRLPGHRALNGGDQWPCRPSDTEAHWGRQPSLLGNLVSSGAGGLRPNEGELSEGAGGTFGRLPRFRTATPEEPLDCAHSKARTFKEAWE